MLVRRQQRLHQDFVCGLIDRVKTVGSRLVGSKHTKVFVTQVQLHDVAQKFSELPSRFGQYSSRLWHAYLIGLEVRHLEVLQQNASVGMWISTHSSRSPRRKLRQLRQQRSIGVK